MLSILNRAIPVAELLLAQSDLTLADISGKSALHLAAERGLQRLTTDLDGITSKLLLRGADSGALSHASKTAFDLAPSGSKTRKLLQQRRTEQEQLADKAAYQLLRQSVKKPGRPKASPRVPQTAPPPVEPRLEEAVKLLCGTWTELDLPLESVANVGLSELSMSQVGSLADVR